MTRELAKMTRRADLVDELEDQIHNLKTQYEATEQKYQTMLTVSIQFFKYVELILFYNVS